ncbi:uncharacterized protein MELLADRAFT_70243 [Melampsora larici-populina 98AG31]|uniref:Uncharacterized protein n=1 Tax=Melampsora larici-populina (strain 98AG31 / pathotype 3-4-7) TaxID=747676 RepID=F4SE62_MELLP|nr:uncharacterized protein MELLADRAFT_70243 [Melampsora larici-populina 98AG31]EGF97065.1 hypothetical protein MELLADRAFT_70243 [Melampsora larici-populina 98AG31]
MKKNTTLKCRKRYTTSSKKKKSLLQSLNLDLKEHAPQTRNQKNVKRKWIQKKSNKEEIKVPEKIDNYVEEEEVTVPIVELQAKRVRSTDVKQTKQKWKGWVILDQEEIKKEKGVKEAEEDCGEENTNDDTRRSKRIKCKKS